jgi:hypothetical protein
MSTICLTLLSLLIGTDSPVANPDVAAHLVGSWRLVSYEDRPRSGPLLFPYGKTPKGLLISSLRSPRGDA